MPAARATLRVATWNVRAALGPGPYPESWWRRIDGGLLERIGRAIAAMDVDVVGLQEVAVLSVDGRLTDQPALLAATAGVDMRFAAARHFAIGEEGRQLGTGLFGNAILSRLPFDSSVALGLPAAPPDADIEPAGSAGPLGGVRYLDAPPSIREPRCVLIAGLRSTGVAVATTHLSHVGSGERALQARAVADALANSRAPVLVGDLNAPIGAAELAPLTHGWTDAFAAVGVPTDDERRSTTEDGMAIDQILVRGVEVIDCRRLDEVGWLSDHMPVLATLQL